MQTSTLSEMFHRLLRAEGESPAAKTVEYFGWLMLAESAVLLFAPHFVAQVLHLPALSEQAANYFRLVGLLVGGLGMLYVASGRLNAEGFVFASLLDRPLVPPVMAVLWYLDIIPGPLALLFAVSDLSSFLWTLLTWRAQERMATPKPA
jgi:hypothetical protein